MRLHWTFTMRLFAIGLLWVAMSSQEGRADLVTVRGKLSGSGLTRSKGGDCYVITPAHVVGENVPKVTITGRGNRHGTASLPAIVGADIALIKIDGEGASAFCTEKWPDAGRVDDDADVQIRYALTDGGEKRIDVRIAGGPGHLVDIRPKDRGQSFFEGLSGGVVYSGTRALAMILRITDTRSSETPATGYSWEYISSLIDPDFNNGITAVTPLRDLWPLWSTSGGMLVVPQRNKMYIADARSEKEGEILVADLNAGRQSQTPLSRIAIGNVGYEGSVGKPVNMLLDPHALDPDTKRPFLYVADARQSKIHVIDINRDVVVGNGFPTASAPVYLAMTRDGGKLFSSNEQPSRTITVLDVSRLSLDDPDNFRHVREISGVGCPEGLAMSPHGETLYAASQCGANRDPVFVIDTEKEKVVNRIMDLAVGRNVLLTSDGHTLYVTRANFPCRRPDGRMGSPFSVVSLNAQSGVITKTICLQTGAELLALTHDEAHLLVSSGNNIEVFDAHGIETAGPSAILNDIQVKSDKEAAMGGIGVTPDGLVYVWIPNTAANTPSEPRLFMYTPGDSIGK